MQIFYRIEVWRLARQLHDLNFFLFRVSFVALAMCFGSLSWWKTHPQAVFNVLAEGRRSSSKILQYLALSTDP